MNTESNDYTVFACPVSGQPLSLVGEALKTADGARSYPLEKGIPNFLRFPERTDTADELLVRLNDVARDQGWKEAVAAVYGERGYVTDPARTGCLDLLSMNDQSSVLEIGCSLGQFTTAIQKRAGTVCAIDVITAQVEFCAERCRQEGALALHPAVGGDDGRLPFRDGSFDVVVLSLVLEWCSTYQETETAETLQRRLLSECCRVLRPGGEFYLSTKNRYALRNVMGRLDEHACDIPFGNALPRWLMNLVLKFTGKGRPTGRLYSQPYLASMLADAGFAESTSYWAAPEMRYPDHHILTDAESVREARKIPGFVQGESRSTRLLMQLIPSSLVKYFTPGLLFISRKG